MPPIPPRPFFRCGRDARASSRPTSNKSYTKAAPWYRHLAMRRTLWVVSADDLPIVQSAASNRVAANEHRRLVADLHKAGVAADGERWLATACSAVLGHLGRHGPLSSTELRSALPEIGGTYDPAPGKPWGGMVPVAPRVLTVLSARGEIVRGPNDGSWTTSKPRWVPTDGLAGAAHHAGRRRRRVDAALAAHLRARHRRRRQMVVRHHVDGGAQSLERYRGCARSPWTPARAMRFLTIWRSNLRSRRRQRCYRASMSPRWVGSTATGISVSTAVRSSTATAMPGPPPGGTDAWWAVGIRTTKAHVQVQLLEDPGRDGRRALTRRATELTSWLDGVRIKPRFPSPLSKSVRTAGT